MSHAELCPVCKGTGKVNEKECHGCQGKGWIEIGDSIPYYPCDRIWSEDTTHYYWSDGIILKRLDEKNG